MLNQVPGGLPKRKAERSIGDSILVVVKSLRKKRRASSKVKKGEIYPALIVRTKKGVYGPRFRVPLDEVYFEK